MSCTPNVTEMHPVASRPKRALFIALPLIGVAVLATACGGGSSKASASAPTSTTAPSSAAGASRAKFTQCLESHGVPASVASSGFGGRRPASGSTSSTTNGTNGSSPGRSSLFTQYQTAFNACRSDLPAGLGQGGNFNSAAFAAYRNCLEIHGVTVPTTAPGSTGGFGGGLGAASRSPAFQAAQKACASLLPARPSSSTTAPPAAS